MTAAVATRDRRRRRSGRAALPAVRRRPRRLRSGAAAAGRRRTRRRLRPRDRRLPPPRRRRLRGRPALRGGRDRAALRLPGRRADLGPARAEPRGDARRLPVRGRLRDGDRDHRRRRSAPAWRSPRSSSTSNTARPAGRWGDSSTAPASCATSAAWPATAAGRPARGSLRGVILAIDQGTTGTTCLVFDRDGPDRRARLQRVPAALPAPGLGRARRQRDLGRHAAGRRRGDRRRRHLRAATSPRSGSRTSARPSSPGIPARGEPVHNALVWQDRRTAARCDELREAGHTELVRERTGLVIDPYFSGTKIEWLRRNVDAARDAVFGTIDSWLVFKLTGRHVSDYSNASRTMLFDIRKLRLGRPSSATCSGSTPRALPEPVLSSAGLRDHRRLRRRGAGRGDRRRPAGGAVRPGLPPAGHGEEHLRHRELRPAEHGHRVARSPGTAC